MKRPAFPAVGRGGNDSRNFRTGDSTNQRSRDRYAMADEKRDGGKAIFAAVAAASLTVLALTGTALAQAAAGAAGAAGVAGAVGTQPGPPQWIKRHLRAGAAVAVQQRVCVRRLSAILRAEDSSAADS